MLLLLLACTASTPGTPSPATATRLGDPGRYASTTLSAPPAAISMWGRSIAVGDFDGDGAPELAVGGLNAAGKGIIHRYAVVGRVLYDTQSLPATSFEAASIPGLSGWGRDGTGLAAVDLDGDGYDDLAILDDGLASWDPSWTARVLVRQGTSAGLAEASAALWYASRTVSNLTALRDPFGDGRNRVAMSVTNAYDAPETARSVHVWDGDEPDPVILTPDADDPYLTPYMAGAVDADRDGRDELIVRITERDPSRPLQPTPVARTTLAWAPADRWPTPQAPAWPWSLVTEHTLPTRPHPPSEISGAADVDLDGVLDLITTATGDDRAVHIYLGIAPGEFEPDPLRLPLEPFDTPLSSPLTPGDFDGDGTLDVLAMAQDGNLRRLYRWSAAPGGPAPTPTEVIDLLEQPGVSSAWSGHLDDDDLIDVVLTTPGSPVRVVWGGAIDCPGGATRQFLDEDGDGQRSATQAVWLCSTPPGASATPGGDCDDANPSVFAGAQVTTPSSDQDCDGLIVCYADADADGRTNGRPIVVSGPTCSSGGRRLLPDPRLLDCDDNDPLDGVDTPGWDRNCDGSVSCYADTDGDGYGGGPVVRVTVPPGERCPSPDWTAENLDCNDQDATASPDGEEVVGGPDEDCDGSVRCWVDDDRDDWGSATEVEVDGYTGCGLSYADQTGDCHDDDWQAWPGSTAPARINYDRDCDGLVDCYADADLDGVPGTDIVPAPSCDLPGFGTLARDCRDANPAIHPLRLEDPNTTWDDNCNGYTAMRAESGLYDIRVVDGPPFTRVGVAWSARRALDATCPSWLGGACLHLVRPKIVGPGTTNAYGEVRINTWLTPRYRDWVQVFTEHGEVGPVKEAL